MSVIQQSNQYVCYIYNIKLVKKEETVGHLSCEFSKISWYFLTYYGNINQNACGDSMLYNVPFRCDLF